MNFKCRFCNIKYRARLRRFTNLNRHLIQDHKNNKKFSEWCEKYSRFNTKSKDGSCFDENMMTLIKYFIHQCFG